ncbi:MULTISPECIES: triacylglycerol lipase [unclassified Synechococcus]|uniref:esterase/lipase family protein n=1 Tax=unclassified Synechococcus TaxID=2626047 RepID=UPI0021A3D1BB|nr:MULTISPECIES: alpha/beta fold hydrolase [unclassified Synechococcus]MCT0212965.1 alpha/beta fold hydrolase [Synechococcus sp. CS-1326]MCT0232209.1 alpha/beta fold hydrolase [Synechococcus sp. CS-1327]
MSPAPPLVLVHGLWDTPRLFRHLKEELAGGRDPLLVPYLHHRLGATRMLPLAERLGACIEAAFGPDQPIDLLGFSMGGVISRTWIQLLGGHRRTRRFFCVASPQRGTPVAQPCPPWLLGGIAELKLGSPLLKQLNDAPELLKAVDCRSFYTPTDQLVVPGWRGVLPVGCCEAFPAMSHQAILRDPRALTILREALLEE